MSLVTHIFSVFVIFTDFATLLFRQTEVRRQTILDSDLFHNPIIVTVVCGIESKIDIEAGGVYYKQLVVLAWKNDRTPDG